MKLYAASLTAIRQVKVKGFGGATEVYNLAMAIVAPSKEIAKQAAVHNLLQHCPKAERWYSHGVDVAEVTQGMIEQVK